MQSFAKGSELFQILQPDRLHHLAQFADCSWAASGRASANIEHGAIPVQPAELLKTSLLFDSLAGCRSMAVLPCEPESRYGKPGVLEISARRLVQGTQIFSGLNNHFETPPEALSISISFWLACSPTCFPAVCPDAALLCASSQKPRALGLISMPVPISAERRSSNPQAAQAAFVSELGFIVDEVRP